MNFRGFSYIVLLVCTLIISTPSTFGWDETGHKISGYIAWQQMTPEVRERVIAILRQAPEDSQISTFYLTYGSRSEETRKREFFMLMTTWGDIVRDRNFPVRFKNYHKDDWHYADGLWTTKNGIVENLPPPANGGKAVVKMADLDAVIRGKASNAEKAVAIVWLEHIIGDIHQPLHSSSRVTDLEPDGDRGGNSFLLSPQGAAREQQVNLHSYWDGIVRRSLPNSSDACDEAYVDPIAQKIMKKYPFDKMRTRIDPGNYSGWAKESLIASQTQVFSPDLVRFQMPSNNYRKKALTLSEERLALAGYRMAALFNQVFGDANTPVAPLP